MKIMFDAEKGTGTGYACLLRQTLIETTASIKPVAFLISDGNMYKCGEDQIDNMKLAALLSDLTYNLSENLPTPFHLHVSFTGDLMSSQLCKSGEVEVLEKDVLLMGGLNPTKQMSITIILDRNYGYKGHTYNRNSLNNSGMNIKGYNVMSARYCDMTVSMEDPIEDLDSEVVYMEVSSKSVNEREKVLESIDKIIETFTNLKNKI